MFVVKAISQMAKKRKLEQIKIAMFEMFTYVMFPLIQPNSMFVIIMHSQKKYRCIYKFMTLQRQVDDRLIPC